MRNVRKALDRLIREEEGQDLVEYGLLAAMIACVAIGAISAFGGLLQNTFWQQVVNFAQNV